MYKIAINCVKEILKFATNRLNKFYNPKLYKAPAAPALVQIEQHINKKDAPGPAPETFGEYNFIAIYSN